MEHGFFVDYPWQPQFNGGLGPCEILELIGLGTERLKEGELEHGGLEEGGLAQEERNMDGFEQEELGRSPIKRRMSSSSASSSENTDFKRVKQELCTEAGKSRNTSEWDTMSHANETI